MTPGHMVTTRPTSARVEVRIDGVLVAESERALVLEETGLPDRYYLPADDVRSDVFRPTSFHTTCPFKGEAWYWTAEIDGSTHDGIVWSYPTPIDGREDIAGLWSFYPDRAQVTVDGTDI